MRRLTATRIVSRRSALQEASGAAIGCLLAGRPFAARKPSVVEAGGSDIEVQFDSRLFDLPPGAILDWVTHCAKAVSAYIGRFPVPHATVQIVHSERARGVGNGRTWVFRGARCEVAIGQDATVEDLKRDWVLTHEMFHLAFPSVPERNRWIEEGISTYAEPIARANIGLVSPERVWNDMMRDIPKGLPEPGDRGLDNTHIWGRTYWGGALYCLLADVGIRKATNNHTGLREALRAINAAGGNITEEWPLLRALDIGDRATGVTVLSGLYREMGSSPFPVDLAALWKQLGVQRNGDRIAFDDRAPLAAIRTSMVRVARPG